MGLQIHNASVHASRRWVANQGLQIYIYTSSLKSYVYRLRVFLARTTSLWVYIDTVKLLPEIKLGFDCVYILFSFSFKSQVTLSLTSICVPHIFSYLLIRYLCTWWTNLRSLLYWLYFLHWTASTASQDSVRLVSSFGW